MRIILPRDLMLLVVLGTSIEHIKLIDRGLVLTLLLTTIFLCDVYRAVRGGDGGQGI